MGDVTYYEAMDKKVARILDANSNRAREAIRVCEEITRLYLNHRRFSSQLKNIRHDITRAVKQLPVSYKVFLEGRDSNHDVGSDMVVFQKQVIDYKDIFIRNMKRAQEAVRVLEEFSKVISKKASGHFQKIRFALYQLERNMLRKVL